MNQNDENRDTVTEGDAVTDPKKVEAAEEAPTSDDAMTLTEVEAEEVPETEEEAQTGAVGEEKIGEEAGGAPKKKMSRKKKIILISLAVFLGLLLVVLIIGTVLFYHYYSKMNVVDRDDFANVHDLNANSRTFLLYDPAMDAHFEYPVNLVGLPNDEVLLLDGWFANGNKELIMQVGKDPAKMTEAEKKALYKKVLAEIQEENDSHTQANESVICILNAKTGKEWDLVLPKDLALSEADYGVLMELAAYQKQGVDRLSVYFDGDPTKMKTEELVLLYTKIATEYRNSQKVRYHVQIKDASGENTLLFVVYKDEITEEQASKIVLFGSEVTVASVPADPTALGDAERKALIDEIIAFIDDAAIVRYTVKLRDPASGTEYVFVMKQTELTADQIEALQKQQGVLDYALQADPNLLQGEERMALIADIVRTINELVDANTVYQILLQDRVSGTQYLFSYKQTEMTKEQWSTIRNWDTEKALLLAVAKNPAEMTEAEKTALVAEIVTEITYPSFAMSLKDPATQALYTLYFRSTQVSAEQLQLLKKQIETGKPYEIAVSKDPSLMTDAEKTALIKAIIDKMTAPVVVEYKMNIRDPGSGKAYVLIFSKEEVANESIFGYLLAQSQKGTVLEINVLADPATMTAAERQAFFAEVADVIKNPPVEPDDPEALEKLKEHLQNLAQNPVQHTDDIYNVLLVGTDERKENDPTKAKNSDTMILATVNYKDGTITLTSLMRDTCVEYTYISGGVERTNTSKLNSAYAVGGIKTLISAIEKNYGVKIDNYVKVNWFSFIDIFEVLGGIDVKVNANHLEKLNLTIKDNCFIFGEDYEKHKLTMGGYQHLNALQTLAYARYRVSDADFGRTARQREVLTLVFEKFKSSSLTTINNIMNTVLPLITTDLTAANCAALLLKFPSVAGYKMQQVRLPEWQEYTSYKGMLVPDWEKTLRRLYRNAYGSLCPDQYK